MPAELLLLLIVAASPSRQVLSSLRMGEAPEAPLHPASPQTLPLGPGAFLRPCRSLRNPGIWAAVWQPPAQLLLPPEPRSRHPRPSKLRFRNLDPFTPPPPCLRAKESRSPAPPPQDPGVRSPTPVFPQLPFWTTKLCVAAQRLALALAREQINGIIEVPAKARVEVDIFELQRDMPVRDHGHQ